MQTRTGQPEMHGALPYLSGLDGLRALAVVAVLLYHADLAWIPGGFLGVEVFFVISGYLITSLLLAEWRQRGGIDLQAFWYRRARRLLPALLLLLGVTLTFAVVWLPGEVAGLRADALAAAGQVTNWYLIFAHKSYFEMMGRPALLRHLWSLAIEAQFYLLWPVCFLLAQRSGSRRRLLVAVLLSAVASGLLMAGLYRPGVDPSRVYFGSDTRAAGLLTGAALALVWVPGQLGHRTGRMGRLLLDAAGIGALGVLAGCCLWIDEFSPFLYRGGFAVVALATAIAIAAAVHPKARLLPGLLGGRLLRWIGQRSYGIYLWHWPVFMVTRPQLDISIDGLPLLALRLVVTGLLTEFSFCCVERPVRKGALDRAWRALREAQGRRRRWLGVRWGAATAALVLFCAVLSVPVVSARPPAPPSYLVEAAIDAPASVAETATVPSPGEQAEDPAPERREKVAALPTVRDPAPSDVQQAATPTAFDLAPPRVLATATPAAPTKRAPAAQAELLWSIALPAVEVAPTFTLAAPRLSSAQQWAFAGEDVLMNSLAVSQATPTPTEAPPVRITAIGDSVMVCAARELERAIPNMEVDAEVGRQVLAGIQVLRTRRDAGTLGQIVVIHLGSNGLMQAEQFDELMEVLQGVRRVIIVNLKVPRRWEGTYNTWLAEGVARYPRAVLVDWHAATADRPELFREDGIHPYPEGVQLYVDLIAASIRASLDGI